MKHALLKCVRFSFPTLNIVDEEAAKNSIMITDWIGLKIFITECVAEEARTGWVKNKRWGNLPKDSMCIWVNTRRVFRNRINITPRTLKHVAPVNSKSLWSWTAFKKASKTFYFPMLTNFLVPYWFPTPLRYISVNRCTSITNHIIKNC